MDIRQISAYTDTVRTRLHQTLADSPEVFERPIETISNFQSIRQLVAHLIGAEERLVVIRIQGQTLEQTYEQRAAPTVDGIFEDWATIRTQTLQVLDALDSEGLARVISITLPQWGFQTEITVEQIFFHLFNHQTFHLGQISMALQQFQIDPPLFDYLFLK